MIGLYRDCTTISIRIFLFFFFSFVFVLKTIGSYSKGMRDLLNYQFTESWAGNWLSVTYARDTAVGEYPQFSPGDVFEVYHYKKL